jgi:hypothetical protein
MNDDGSSGLLSATATGKKAGCPRAQRRRRGPFIGTAGRSRLTGAPLSSTSVTPRSRPTRRPDKRAARGVNRLEGV